MAKELDDDTWQFRARAMKKGIWKKVAKDDYRTRLVDGACIFLNRPGFAGGPGCALHRAALRRGERPLDWKPDVCWQLPLRRIDETDAYGWVTSTVREWKRRDWGPGGQEFHWWCTETDEAFVGAEPVYETLRDDIVELVGTEPYEVLHRYLTTRRTETLLPHPAVRRGPRDGSSR